MVELFRIFYQFCDSFAFLLLSAIGLAVIFGMMGIINQAHGEFIMLGAYISSLLAVRANVPLPAAILAGAIGTGLFGLVIDRLIICRLYNRPLDSIVVTWGISLIMSQGMRILLGPSIEGKPTPLGSFVIGNEKYSVYRMLLVVIAIGLVILVYWLFMHTDFGLKARATMQKCDIANSLGVNSNKMYALTFMFGSALAGLVGGLYAPTLSVVPGLGSNFNMQAFVTVIVGGANPLVGTIMSSSFLGLVNSSLSMLFGTFIGKVGLMIMAILFIRLCPLGFSGMADHYSVKRGKRV